MYIFHILYVANLVVINLYFSGLDVPYILILGGTDVNGRADADVNKVMTSALENARYHQYGFHAHLSSTV